MGGGTGMPMAPIGMGIKPSRGGDGTNSGDGWTGSRTGGAGGFSTVAIVCEARGGLSGGLALSFRRVGRSPRGGAMYIRIWPGCDLVCPFYLGRKAVFLWAQLAWAYEKRSNSSAEERWAQIEIAQRAWRRPPRRGLYAAAFSSRPAPSLGR